MPHTYRQKNCPVARTLDIVGERWTLLILRDFFLHGSRRYQDLEDSLAGIAPNTLAARLKTLEDAGFAERKLYSDSPPRLEYHLTGKGKSFGPVMRAMREWGHGNT